MGHIEAAVEDGAHILAASQLLQEGQYGLWEHSVILVPPESDPGVRLSDYLGSRFILQDDAHIAWQMMQTHLVPFCQ